MDKVGIVVLNYLNYEDTIECVESLLDLNYDNFEIVIVDNGSDNNSYEILNDEFENHPKIHLLNTGENLGYAKGNNYGIDFCRKSLNVDHVLVINNDTIAEDKDLLNVLIKHKNEGIILGPKIINLDGKNQNPIQHYKFNIFSDFKILIKGVLYYLNLGNYFTKKYKKVYNTNSNKRIENESDKEIVLHGSCVFFTKKFFSFYKGFFNKTFLYGEENILYLLVKKVNEDLKYVSKVKIIHKEDGASKISYNNNNSIKEKFKFKSYIWFLILRILPYKFIKIFFKI